MGRSVFPFRRCFLGTIPRFFLEDLSLPLSGLDDDDDALDRRVNVTTRETCLDRVLHLHHHPSINESFQSIGAIRFEYSVSECEGG